MCVLFVNEQIEMSLSMSPRRTFNKLQTNQPTYYIPLIDELCLLGRRFGCFLLIGDVLPNRSSNVFSIGAVPAVAGAVAVLREPCLRECAPELDC